ncbi:SDR family oxidoreductase [Saliphagus infecundisoli]|uniref:SDR family oxidoreductase n=1 Tax=Saliphagus infecundisoli TaxID=1849069 RepID=A0ABD5QHX1_9EURY|nr:SDR family oxidoreductase [Saliphagus infecundisoli]
MSNATDSEVVVITGASAGAGRVTARAFAERGAKIGLLARGEDGLRGACEDVERAGGEAIVVPTDVADPEQVETAAETVEDAFGPIDVWVNDAMASVFSPAAEMTAEDYRRVTEVTYLGYVYGTQAALNRMRPRNEGTIVQVGSALAYRGIPLQSAYCGAKHAIQGYTESVRTELLHEDCDIQLSMVQMPAMNTPQFEWSKSRLPQKPQPVPPIYQPEVAARAIMWTVDHGKDELWVGRSTVKAILGNRLIPRRLDNYLASGGYDSQLTDEPVAPDRKHNLYEPVAGDFGAHGPFDDQAHDYSYQLQASMHRRLLALLVGLLATIVTVVLGQRIFSD